MTFRDLAKNVGKVEQVVRIATPDNERSLTVIAGPRNRPGRIVGDADDVFTLSVPRSCIGDREEVRVRLGSATVMIRTWRLRRHGLGLGERTRRDVRSGARCAKSTEIARCAASLRP